MLLLRSKKAVVLWVWTKFVARLEPVWDRIGNETLFNLVSGSMQFSAGNMHKLIWSETKRLETRRTKLFAEAYESVYRNLRELYDRSIEHNSVNAKYASASCFLQMAHETEMLNNSNQRWTTVLDKFYARHLLGHQLKIFSNHSIGIIGTVQFNNVDSFNRPLLKKAMSTMSDKLRGS